MLYPAGRRAEKKLRMMMPEGGDVEISYAPLATETTLISQEKSLYRWIREFFGECILKREDKNYESIICRFFTGSRYSYDGN